MAVSFCGFIPEKHSTSAPFRQVFRAYAKLARRKINGRQPPPVKIATIFLRGKIFARQKDFREISSRLFCARTKSRELKFTEPGRVALRCGRYNKVTPSVSLRSTASRAVETALLLIPKNSLCDFFGNPFPEINTASKTTLLRSRTQFVPYGYLLSNKDKTVRGR